MHPISRSNTKVFGLDIGKVLTEQYSPFHTVQVTWRLSPSQC